MILYSRKKKPSIFSAAFIYNQWGEVIFNSENIQEQWDGTVGDSRILPVGQHSYLINIVDEMEVSHIFKGNLLLQK